MRITRLLAIPRKFLRDEAATTMVEFAMVGVAFFFILFGIFTVALDMFLQETFDDAVRAAARQVQVGTVTTGAQFQSALCNEFGIAGNGCMANVEYSVQVATSFAQMNTVTLNSDGTLSTGTSDPFGPVTTTAEGTPEFMLVQAEYPVPFTFLKLANGVATENGTSSLYAVTAEVVP